VNRPEPRKRVIFFGDSVCHGQYVSVERVFVARLATYHNGHVVPPVVVENRSINGNTTRQGLERLSYDVTSHRPDFVYVQFGLNDCNIWQTDFGEPRVALEAYRANLTEIVRKVRAAGTRRVMLATNHPCRLGDAYEERLRAYNEVVRAVAAGVETALFDVRAASEPFDPDVMLLADGIHLSEDGHEFYFEALRPLFMAELDRLAGGKEEDDARDTAPPAVGRSPVAP
jgi:lysophospholipase L1-like esterase